MATARKKAALGTQLETGDLLAWRTRHGEVLVWVFTVIDGTPLLELLEGVGPPPKRPETLAAATCGPGERPWFFASGLVEREDPGGDYRVLRRGFERASFVPSRESKFGLGAVHADRKRLGAALTSFAWSRTEGKAELAMKAAAERKRATHRAKLRAKATPASQTLAARAVSPWRMTRPSPRAREVHLSLRGRESHVVYFEPGVGNLYIGPTKQPRATPHALVAPTDVLAWDVLDAIPKTGAGYAMPRWLRYEGNDVGIFDWLARREHPLERLELVTTGPFQADASGANLTHLVIEARHPIELTVSPELVVDVEGTARLLTLRGGKSVPQRAPTKARRGPRFAWKSAKKTDLRSANALYERLKKDRSNEGLDALVDVLNAMDLFTLEREDVFGAVAELFPEGRARDRALARLNARRTF